MLIKVCALVFSLFLLSNLNFSAAESCTSDSQSNIQEAKLTRKILCGYDPDIRPRRDYKSVVNVTIRMVLKGLEQSHDGGDQMRVSSWMAMRWTDDFLKWNPADYGDIRQVAIYSTKIWTPDFSLYNSVTEASSKFQSHCAAYSTGVVICIPQLTHVAVCSNDYALWPFDQQNCTLTFGNWIMKGEEVNFYLGSPAIDTGDYTPSKKWDLVKGSASRYHGVYDGNNGTFPTLRFSFLLKRHTGAISCFLLPGAFALIILTSVPLFLDAQSTNRMVMLLFDIDIHLIVQSTVLANVPSNGDKIPNGVIFFRDSFILCGIVLCYCLLMTYVVRKTTAPPLWINMIMGAMQTNAGKIIMFNEFEPGNSASQSADTENLTKNDIEASANREWKQFGVLCDRLCLAAIWISYVIFTIRFLF